MKLISSKSGKLLLSSFILFSPLIASAQTITTVPTLFTYALNILNVYVVPIIFAIAFVFFIYGVYRYFIQNGGNAEKVQEGQKFVLWSIIGFVIMFSVWGIINLFINTLGFGGASQPAFPTFNSSGTSGSSAFSGSTIACIFGNCAGSSSYNSSGGSLGTVGSLYTASNGQTYTIVGSNSVAPSSTGCPPGFSASGLSCVQSSGSAGTTGGAGVNNNPNPGDGTLGLGASCEANAQACSSGYVCQENSNGDDTCVTAAGATGQIACDTGSVPAGSQCAVCSNGETADTGSDCPSGSSASVPGNGTLGQGGDCEENTNACQAGLTCQVNSSGDDTCVSSSAANSQSCNDGTTGTCLMCNDGITSTNCNSDCGVQGSTNTCTAGADSGGSVSSQGNSGS